ncbi:unnamed protein product [Spirodela intermedia]|uniref:4-coumarate--CoA ligase n=1 Tax=Spirodela intermedia TaxID=51605 RepID=A0A7I8L938_SPIIN|nr:unnamed protein product [Spirodela intermedia]
MRPRVEDGHDEPCRCISHEFFRSASKDPCKIAIVHASGGIQICREIKDITLRGENSTVLDKEWLSERSQECNSSPVYQGDVSFTYGEVLSAVESLSCRIRQVLDGGDDPDLLRPKGHVHSTQSIGTQISDSSGGFHRKPQIVGVHIAPSVEYVIAILSILRCGEAFLPLDPLWPQERLLYVAACSRTDLIITCSISSQGGISVQNNKTVWVQDRNEFSVLYFSMGSTLPKNGPSELDWPCKAKSPRLYCYLMYTSGSTGKPKGVCGTEEGLINRFSWMQQFFPLCSGEILLFKTPISFVDHLQEILTAVLSCAPLIIPPFDDLKVYPFYLVDILKVYCISRLVIVPSLARAVLPASERSKWIHVQKTLKLLVLSGETLSISLWNLLCGLLPETIILNLYGSTEVSGDCTFFDCTYLPKILETEVLSSVPIGKPIPNCDVTLLGQSTANEGEIYVSGSCVFAGYFDDISQEPLVKKNHPPCFKTGDFARRLQSGDLLFIGRKDRSVKVNGQRIALEEIEDALRGHPEVEDAAVVLESQGEAFDLKYLKAHTVLRKNAETQEKLFSSDNLDNRDKSLAPSIRSWLARRLPLVMIPSSYLFVESLPMSSSGKVDYTALESSESISKRQVKEFNENQCFYDHLQIMKQAFCDALLIEKVEDNDDFFALGGNSILAALLSHRLGIDMRLVYSFPSPASLVDALLGRKAARQVGFHDGVFQGKRLKLNTVSGEVGVDHSRILAKPGDELGSLRMDSVMQSNRRNATTGDESLWFSRLHLPKLCSFSRCNRFIHGEGPQANEVQKYCTMTEIPRSRTWDMREIWKVPLGSCVDASPLVVLKNFEILIFIGSHSHIFFCLDALSGIIRWKTQLEGRVECSAVATIDFSHVVVGCYEGKIYFLDFVSGVISWTFQTSGEVKMQPVAWKNLVWCGSHDHWIYALDYVQQCCVYRVSCGGSPYGSPAVDMVRNMIYIASTSGRVTAVSAEAPPFRVAWLYESGAPIFGSLSLDALTGNVICCSVDGHVIALNSEGSMVWKAATGGPIFAGACMSSALPSQVLVCSRDGSVYSFESESGGLLWEHQVGDPITSSAYVDEQMRLVSEPSMAAHRLVCVCGSSGRIRLLQVDEDQTSRRSVGDEGRESSPAEEVGGVDLPGEVFSSPVMIAGRVFVGCRDDHVRCIGAIVSAEASTRF